MVRLIRSLTGLWALFALLGCGSATKVTKVWVDPAAEAGSLRKLMVVGVGKTPTARRVFEDRFSAALKAIGVEAVPSYPYVGDVGLDSAAVTRQMHEAHCDAVFVTRLVDRKTVRGYSSPAVPHYGGWYDYYSRSYAYAAAPGYTVENQVVNFETNLYRVSDGRLVWSALSREWLELSETPGDDSAPFVRALVAALVKSNAVISGQRNPPQLHSHR